MIRHHFFKEADLGARIVREVCKFHFFDFRFYFLSKVRLTTVTHLGAQNASVVQILLFQFSFLFSLKSEIDDSYTL